MTVGALQRALHLAIERDAVEAVDAVLALEVGRIGQQVLVQVTQVDAGHGADTAFTRHGTGQLFGGNADTHPALHDRQQAAAANHERGKGMGAGHGKLSVGQRNDCGGKGVRQR